MTVLKSMMQGVAGVTNPCIMKNSTVMIVGSVIYHMKDTVLSLISKVGLPL